MNQIQYEINGVKYLLIEREIHPDNRVWLLENNKAHDAIYQGVRRPDSWPPRYGIITILIPEAKIKSYLDNEHKLRSEQIEAELQSGNEQ